MEKTWRTIIDGNTSPWKIDFKEIWQYKTLIWMLFKRNYSVEYKQTILGPLWMIFSVVFNTGILTLVFGYVGKMSSDGVPYFLFCISGNVLWNLFSTSFHANTGVLRDNSYIFGKVYFPRLIVPLSNTLLCLVRALLQFAVCILLWSYFLIKGNVNFTGIRLLAIIPLFLLSSAMGTSLGLIICTLTVKYRDFSHLTGVIMSALMYLSPVLYPTSQLSPLLRSLVYLNPISSYIEAFRYCLGETETVTCYGLLYSSIFTVAVTVLALLLYNRTEKDFIDLV